MSEVICPYCMKNHEIGKFCNIDDLWSEQTKLLAKYLKTAPLQSKHDSILAENAELKKQRDEWKEHFKVKDELCTSLVTDLAAVESEIEVFGRFAEQFGDLSCCYDAKDVTSVIQNSIDEKLTDAVTALDKASDIIHSEFCGKEHHEFCVDIELELKKIKGT